MRLLFCTDVIVDAIINNPSKLNALLDSGNMDGWILSSALPDAYRQITESLGEKPGRDALGNIVNKMSLLPMTGIDMVDSLAQTGSGFMENLSALAVDQYKLDGVVTSLPESFASTTVDTFSLDDISEKIKNPAPSEKGNVPLLDIPSSYHQWLNEAEHALWDVVRSGRFVLGQAVQDFEEKAAAYSETRFALGVSSGTDALLLALMAAKVGPGDEVITTPFTFFATMGSIVRLGAKPVLVDIDPVTFNLDVKQIESAITSNTKVILPVHLYGQCADMKPIQELARKHDLLIIEDAAQAIGARYEGKCAGGLGDIGCLSFFPTKNLGGFGDAGMVTTNSEALHESMNILRVHGMQPKYFHPTVGGNFRIDAIQAAVLSAKITFLNEWTNKRRNHAKRYDELMTSKGLDKHLVFPAEKVAGHVFNQYVIRVKDGRRDALREHLGKNGIAAEIYYPLCLHQQECFQSLGYNEGSFPEAERAAKEVLALPVFPELRFDQQDRVVQSIQNFFS